jgi:hypothetical protein
MKTGMHFFLDGHGRVREKEESPHSTVSSSTINDQGPDDLHDVDLTKYKSRQLRFSVYASSADFGGT